MYPITNYEMTEDDLRELLDACQSVPCIMVGSHVPSSPQENANQAWARLGEKMGFDSTTVKPGNKGQRFFTAVPNETEIQRQERELREAKEKRQAQIKRLKDEIANKQAELGLLEG